MGIIMESKADAMKKSGAGGNVNVEVAAAEAPVEESVGAAVDAQEEINLSADVTESPEANEPAAEGVGSGVPVKPERKKAVRGGRGGRKKG